MFKGAKQESVKTEVKSEKKDDLPSTSSALRSFAMRQLESSDEEEQAAFSQEATVSDSDTEPSFSIKVLYLNLFKKHVKMFSARKKILKISWKIPVAKCFGNFFKFKYALSFVFFFQLDDTVMDKIFDQTKKKRRSGSGESSQSVSRQSSTESITVDEDQSPGKPKTRARGRPKKNPPKAKPKPKKLTVASAQLKIK